MRTAQAPLAVTFGVLVALSLPAYSTAGDDGINSHANTPERAVAPRTASWPGVRDRAVSFTPNWRVKSQRARRSLGAAPSNEDIFSFEDPPWFGGPRTTCFWYVGPFGGSGGVNAAYPDGGAQYVNAYFRRPAGSRLLLRGKYPHARYSSLITYDINGAALDGVADYQIRPDDGSKNPFLFGASRTVPDDQRDWTVEVLDEVNPNLNVKVRYGEPEKDAIYGRSEISYEEVNGERFYLQTILYRVYIPDEGYDSNGGVDYPEPELILEDGTRLTGQALCDATDSEAKEVGGTRFPPIQALFVPQGTYQSLRYPNLLSEPCEALVTQPPELGGNGCPTPWAGPEVPAAAPQQPKGTPLLQTPREVPAYFPAQRDPVWRAQFDRRNLLQLYTGDDAPGAAYDPVAGSGGGGFYPNIHNQYVRTAVNRSFGDVLVVVGKLPTSPTTYHGDETFGDADTSYQVRYTSLCMNESFRSTRVMDCLFDEELPVDADGYYTAVFSSRKDRPANAKKACGVGWAEWKTTGDGAGYMDDDLVDPDFGMLQIRNMLADPSFSNATFNVVKAGTEEEVMEEYLPTLTYMSRTQFQRGGCKAATNKGR